MGGLRFVGLDFAKMPPVVLEREGARGDRGGEEVRSKAVCALDGTGEDAPEPPEIRDRPVIGVLLLLP
jgi:hypothetical protein